MSWRRKWNALWCRLLGHTWVEAFESKGVMRYTCVRCGADVEQYKELL